LFHCAAAPAPEAHQFTVDVSHEPFPTTGPEPPVAELQTFVVKAPACKAVHMIAIITVNLNVIFITPASFRFGFSNSAANHTTFFYVKIIAHPHFEVNH
jgi:hypothetical protein